ncbi:MAG: hypothetical protein H7X84_04940 [Verrucomicrobia bacterium]|nr:hypothetical protein [Prolixibacteraceae bacterium]
MPVGIDRPESSGEIAGTGGWRIKKLSAVNGNTGEAMDDAWTKLGSGDFQSPLDKYPSILC